MILADTSVWVEHLRRSDPRLERELERGAVWTHPFVIGELACGRLRDRRVVLHLLGQLPTASAATDREALAFIEVHRLDGRGIGYVDVHLLASTALGAGMRLWTLDRRLGAVAEELGLRAG